MFVLAVVLGPKVWWCITENRNLICVVKTFLMARERKVAGPRCYLSRRCESERFICRLCPQGDVGIGPGPALPTHTV